MPDHTRTEPDGRVRVFDFQLLESVMPHQNFTYRVSLPLAASAHSGEAESSPIVRVWSCQSIDHAAFIRCESNECADAHLWFLLCDPTQASQLAMTDAWQQHCASALLVLALSDPLECCVQAIQDVVFALQCDWTHSAMANADMEDLVGILGQYKLSDHARHSQLRMGTAISCSTADFVNALNQAWHQAFRPGTRQMLLLRAHAQGDFQLKSPEFADWRKTVLRDISLVYWDVYDPKLLPGQKRFTVLVGD